MPFFAGFLPYRVDADDLFDLEEVWEEFYEELRRGAYSRESFARAFSQRHGQSKHGRSLEQRLVRKREYDFLLVGEMLVNRALGVLDAVRDVVHSQAQIALLGEQIAGNIQD